MERQMQSLVVFTIPGIKEVDVSYNYWKEVERGRQQAIDEKSLPEFLTDPVPFDPANVGWNYGRKKVDETVRKSETCDDVKELKMKDGEKVHEPKEFLHERVKDLAPPNYRSCIMEKDKYDGCICVKYLEGGFFKKHQDSIKNQHHFATILVLIPTRLSPHTGGTLRVWDENDKLHEFSTETMDDVTVVMFHPSLMHEVLPVTSGTRVVFKYDYHYNKELFYLAAAPELGDTAGSSYNADSEVADVIMTLLSQIDQFKIDISHGKDDIQEDIRDRRRHIERLIEELVEASQELKKVENSMCQQESTYNVDALIRVIQESEKPLVIVRLVNFYPQASKAFLYEADATLHRKLREIFPKIGIRNMMEKWSEYDMSNTSGTLKDYRPNRDSGWGRHHKTQEDKKTKLVDIVKVSTYIKTREYEYDSETDVPKETDNALPTVSIKTNIGVRERRSEYNDSTYDTRYNSAYTCFIINKE